MIKVKRLNICWREIPHQVMLSLLLVNSIIDGILTGNINLWILYLLKLLVQIMNRLPKQRIHKFWIAVQIKMILSISSIIFSKSHSLVIIWTTFSVVFSYLIISWLHIFWFCIHNTFHKIENFNFIKFLKNKSIFINFLPFQI